MLEAAIWLAIGAGAGIGCLTGLVPGLHPNTVAALLVAGAVTVPGPTAVLLVAAATSHTFLNAVPALVLGVGDPDSVLARLPGHELIRRGAGEDAVLHSAAGSLVGLLASLAVAPALFVLVDLPVEVPLRPALAVALAGLTAFVLVQETGPVPIRRRLVPCFDGVVGDRDPIGLGEVSDPEVALTGQVASVDGDTFLLETDGGRVVVEDVDGWADTPLEGETVTVHGARRWRPGPGSRWAAPLAAAVVFLSSGLLGQLAQGVPFRGVLGESSPLLPLLTGLFGGGTLALAGGPDRVPDQLPGVEPPDRSLPKLGLAGLAAGSLVAALPGVTAAQGTAVASAGRARDPETTVARIAAVNTSAAVLSLAVLFAFDRVRSGVADALTRLPARPAPWVLLAAMLVAGAVAFPVTIHLGRRVVGLADRFAARRAALVVLAAVAGLVGLLAGPWGLVLFAVATALGTVPPRIGVRRIHLMGSLLAPLLWSLWIG